MFKLWLISFIPCCLIAFVLYGWDKRQARLERWRVSEKTLHGIALLGGWPGAFLGQQMFRHKTQKTPFRVMFWLTAIGNLAIGYLLFRYVG